MTILHTVRDWLLLVGQQYNVDEAHFRFRPDDENKQRRPHFLYWFESAEDGTRAVSSLDTSTYDDNDKTVILGRPRLRTLIVQCVDYADGMSVLESLALSIEHPAIQDILVNGRNGHGVADSESRLVVMEDLGISNDTTHDETDIDHVYTQRFTIRRHASFTLIRENIVADDLSLSGKLYKLDDTSSIPITITD